MRKTSPATVCDAGSFLGSFLDSLSGGQSLPRPPESFDAEAYVAYHSLDDPYVILEDPLGVFALRAFASGEGHQDMLPMIDFTEHCLQFQGTTAHPPNVNQLLAGKRLLGLDVSAPVPQDSDRHQDLVYAAVVRSRRLSTSDGDLPDAKQRARLYDEMKESASRAIIHRVMGHFKKSEYFTTYVKLHWAAGEVAQIGKAAFKFFKPVGKSAFGTTCKAQQRYTGKLYSVKFIEKQHHKNEKAMRYAKREICVLQALAANPSPFVLPLAYAFEDPNCVYFAKPLRIGGSLQVHLDGGGAFTVPQATQYAAEVALGLQHIHNMGFVHRDLKPSNVILDDEGRCAISDLGFAVRFSEEHNSTPSRRHVGGGCTVAGRVGTPGYGAPEMLAGKTYGPAADWWSYGATIFEFFAGAPLFRSPHSPPSAVGELQGGDHGAIIDFPLSYRFDFKYHSTTFTDAFRKLICKLLDPDVERRIEWCGWSDSTSQRAHNVFYDKAFSEINWAAFREHDYVPEYLPDTRIANKLSAMTILEQPTVTVAGSKTEAKVAAWTEQNEADREQKEEGAANPARSRQQKDDLVVEQGFKHTMSHHSAIVHALKRPARKSGTSKAPDIDATATPTQREIIQHSFLSLVVASSTKPPPAASYGCCVIS